MVFPPDKRSPAPEQAPKQRKLKSVGIPVLAGILGIGLGASAGSAGAQAELSELRSTEQTLVVEVAQLETAQDAAEIALDKVTEAREASNQQLTERDGEIRDLKAQAEKLQQQISDLESKTADAQARAEAAEAQAAAASAGPVPFAAPQAAAPQQPAPPATYFQNCTAAREAGAAPVWAGDPGYGPHLDRDGDGVGCE